MDQLPEYTQSLLLSVLPVGDYVIRGQNACVEIEGGFYG